MLIKNDVVEYSYQLVINHDITAKAGDAATYKMQYHLLASLANENHGLR